MANPEHHIVVSWTAGDSTNCWQYMVAIYPYADACEPDDFVTIDDTNDMDGKTYVHDLDRAKIRAAIDAYIREYNLDADSLQITWDI